ncbi:hypothetical protein [Pseudonocardia sp. NPDC049154]|uniref:hypothetical protein n=1 Tax=Pseudonocardia sp. NPDC049154 TaxID=3155501 RepID=UPI0033F2D5F6
MSTTITLSESDPEGPEDRRRDAARPGPVQDRPAQTSRPGVWASALAGMDCYGYGLGYDYYTALRAANSRGPAPREAGAPPARTGRAVAVAVGGVLAAAAVAGGLIIGLGGHSTPSVPAVTTHTGTATVAHGSGPGCAIGDGPCSQRSAE